MLVRYSNTDMPAAWPMETKLQSRATMSGYD